MRFIRTIASSILSGAIACALLAGCGGGGGASTTAAALPTAKFTTLENGLSVTFNGSASVNADGTAPGLSWNFGDNGTSTLKKPIHVYASAGSYTVVLTVTDEYGNRASSTQTVTVTAANAIGLEPWTWIAGSNTVNAQGTYGTEGTPSTANAPGARQGAASWTDTQGRLWLFGGSGYGPTAATGMLNDLWRFDPANGQWSWINGTNTTNASGVYGTRGTPAATNIPGARANAVQWTDAAGNFWLFGGTGYDSTGTLGNLNDLWMISATTGQAVWIGGSNTANASGTFGTQGVANAANMPGARSYATNWTDATGKLWLFGGQAINASGSSGVTLNDLWVFDPASKLWTWVGGSATATNAAGVYGTQGIGSTANLPGARINAQSWTDAAGNIWLFGGSGYDSAGTGGVLNDMWSFNPATGKWTWVSGSNLAGAAGVYGTEGVTAAANTPSARLGMTGWTDAAGMLWLFGGGGYDSTGTNTGELSDLWKFNPTSGQWTWVGGVGTANSQGVYSALNVTSLYNTPGARAWSTGWIDANGAFWLFGGAGMDAAGNVGNLNDLWKVKIAP